MQANLRSVQARRAFIARELNALRSEDSELETVEAVLARLSAGSASNVRAKTPIPGRAAIVNKNAKAKRNAGGASQRDLVLSALKSATAPWLDARQIAAAVKAAHKVSIQPRSLSPLLSNLKTARAIVRKGRQVALTERAKSAAK